MKLKETGSTPLWASIWLVVLLIQSHILRSVPYYDRTPPVSHKTKVHRSNYMFLILFLGLYGCMECRRQPTSSARGACQSYHHQPDVGVLAQGCLGINQHPDYRLPSSLQALRLLLASLLEHRCGDNEMLIDYYGLMYLLYSSKLLI